MTEQPLSGRITLVTGATRGIGYHAALALAEAGSHIIAVGRTQGGLEDLDDLITSRGGECTLVPLDLKNFDGIDQLGAIINERWGRLDGLLGNAGLLTDLTPANQIDPKDFEDIFRAFWGAYAASKAAMETFVNSYAEEIGITNIRVNILNPGGTATKMRAKAMPGEDPSTIPQPQNLAPLIVEMLSPSYKDNGKRVNFRETAHYART